MCMYVRSVYSCVDTFILGWEEGIFIKYLLSPLIPVGAMLGGGVTESENAQEGCVDFVFSLRCFPWAEVIELCLYLLKCSTPSA